MKILKFSLLVLLVLCLLGILALRIRKVISAENTGTFFDKKGATEMGFMAAEYLPESGEIKINNTLTFKPGSVWIQDDIRVKHRFFIFSEYYVKSPISSKHLIYSSDDNPNDLNLVLTSSREDTTFGGFSTIDNLNDYSLNQELKDNQNRIFKVEQYVKVDTLKFYIKKAYLKPLAIKGGKIISKYPFYTTAFNKEPLDSILFIKVKK